MMPTAVKKMVTMGSASPAFEAAYEDHQLEADRMGMGKPKPTPGGLEWKVRLCLLVAIASPQAREGPDGVRTRHLVQDGSRGQWGSSWKAAQTIAPLERPAAPSSTATSPTTPNANGLPQQTGGGTLSWMSYIASSLLGPPVGFHDGDEELDGADDPDGDGVGPEEAWREVKV